MAHLSYPQQRTHPGSMEMLLKRRFYILRKGAGNLFLVSDNVFIKAESVCIVFFCSQCLSPYRAMFSIQLYRRMCCIMCPAALYNYTFDTIHFHLINWILILQLHWWLINRYLLYKYFARMGVASTTELDSDNRAHSEFITAVINGKLINVKYK